MGKKFPCKFVEALQVSIEAYKREIDPSGPTVIYIVAPAQADPCVAKLIMDGDADSLVFNDGDFHMYIGTSGRDLMMKGLTLSAREDKVSTVMLQTSQKVVADQLEKFLERGKEQSQATQVFNDVADGRSYS